MWHLETGVITDENQDLTNLVTLLNITTFLVKNFPKKYTNQLDIHSLVKSVTDIETTEVVNTSEILSQLESLSQEQHLEQDASSKLNESRLEQAEGILEFRTEEEVEKQWKVLTKKLKQAEKEKKKPSKKEEVKVVKHLTDFLSHLTQALTKASKDEEEELKLAELCASDFEKALAKDAHSILQGR